MRRLPRSSPTINPMLKPHDLRHGVAMEILETQHDLEAMRAMLNHVGLETTQIYAQIRPAQLKRAVEFCPHMRIGAACLSRISSQRMRAAVVGSGRVLLRVRVASGGSVFESRQPTSSNTEP